MKRVIVRAIAALLSVSGLQTTAAAANCASQADMDALRTAAMQQELMVAALSCHEIARYNQFVLSHQPELIGSDGRLKAFFVAHGGRTGEAAYHTYKTELANNSSLRSIREVDTFCGEADRKFDAASEATNLSSLLHSGAWTMNTPYQMCPTVQADSSVSPQSGAGLTFDERHDGRRAQTWPNENSGTGVEPGRPEMSLPTPHQEIGDTTP